jgi:hypothetical protein
MDCPLNSVTFGKNSNLQTIGARAFSTSLSEDSEMEDLVLPDKLVAIGADAFAGFVNLKTVTLGKGMESFNKDIIPDSEGLTSVSVSNDNPVMASKDGVLFSKDMATLFVYPVASEAEKYDIPTNVTSIGDGAFFNSKNLKTINITINVTTIGDSAFAGCSSLTEVVLPENVVTVGEKAFADCSSLEKVVLGDSLETIASNAFARCNNLKTVFFQGTKAVPSSCGFGDGVTSCVSQFYAGTEFCGYSVETPSDTCEEFREKFDWCHRGIVDEDGNFATERTKNAEEWDSLGLGNDCVVYQCVDDKGFLWWNNCNTSDSERMMCTNKQCSVYVDLHVNTVEVEFYEGDAKVDDVNVTEIDTDDILSVLNTEYSIETNAMTMGWEGNTEGHAIRLVIQVADEETAKSSENAFKDLQSKGDLLFSRAKKITLFPAKRDLSASARTTSSVIMTILLLFITIMMWM